MIDIFFLCVYFCFPQSIQQEFQDNFYGALSSVSVEVLDNQIKVLDSLPSTSLIRAYQGTVIMKRSSYEVNVKDKIVMFKEGHTLLEKEISKDAENVEYLFLRLVIQENAPSILKYNTNISTDKAVVIKQFLTLSVTVRKHILKYSETSKILSSSELQ